jgi:hypothetical protein
MSLNIFEIWDKIGRKTPFAVRRDNWTEEYYTIVEKVECEKLPYGKAFGYPTIDGKYNEHYQYDKKWREEKLIPCCGCYQWTLVDNVDVNKGLTITEVSVKRIKIKAYSMDSKFDFGKYKGVTLKDVSLQNSKYILWAIVNVDKFSLTNEAMADFEQIDSDIKLNSGIQYLNEQKLSQIQ